MRKVDGEYKKEVLRLATFIGQLMLENGAETIRVDEAVKRICKSRGFYHISVFIAPTTIIVSDDRFDGYTFMKVIKNRSIDLNKVDLLNDFSRKFVDDRDMDTKSAIKELKKLDLNSPHSEIKRGLWTAIGSASFAVLAGGHDLVTMFFTLVICILAIFIYEKVSSVMGVDVFGTATASLFIGLCAISLVELGVLQTPKMLIIGSIMPLLPGISFLKAIRDLVTGELVSGTGRFMEANLTAISIAVGIGTAMNMYYQIGGVL